MDPVAGNGEAATISVSLTVRVDDVASASREEVLVGATSVGVEVEVAGEGNGGRLLTVVVWGVAGAEGTPDVRDPLMAGTEDTGGSCRGSVGAPDDTGESSVNKPEKLGVAVVVTGPDEVPRTDSTMDSAMEAVLKIAASWPVVSWLAGS